MAAFVVGHDHCMKWIPAGAVIAPVAENQCQSQTEVAGALTAAVETPPVMSGPARNRPGEVLCRGFHRKKGPGRVALVAALNYGQVAPEIEDN